MDTRKNNQLLIGITGPFGSGKTTAASFLENKGFKKITLSSFLETEAHKRGQTPITRQILQDIGNEWRQEFGPGILARKALEYIEKNSISHAVIDGIRNIGEIDELRKHSQFKLLGVVANRTVRFNRLVGLKRRENLTWEIFDRLDRRDLGIGEARTGLQVAFCLALADIFIENNTSEAEFAQKLQEVQQLLETVRSL